MIKVPTWQLTVSDSFSAAHALRHYQGKCENLHGHNFKAEICVEGTSLSSDTNILIDFKILKSILKKNLDCLDHCILNEKQPFDTINPSSENIAKYLWQKINKELALCKEATDNNVHLISVTISEKKGQQATYLEKTRN